MSGSHSMHNRIKGRLTQDHSPFTQQKSIVFVLHQQFLSTNFARRSPSPFHFLLFSWHAPASKQWRYDGRRQREKKISGKTSKKHFLSNKRRGGSWLLKKSLFIGYDQWIQNDRRKDKTLKKKETLAELIEKRNRHAPTHKSKYTYTLCIVVVKEHTKLYF